MCQNHFINKILHKNNQPNCKQLLNVNQKLHIEIKTKLKTTKYSYRLTHKNIKLIFIEVHT